MYVCINACMNTDMYACIYSGFVFPEFKCDCLYGYSLHWPSPHPTQRLVKQSLDRPSPSLGLNPNVG